MALELVGGAVVIEDMESAWSKLVLGGRPSGRKWVPMAWVWWGRKKSKIHRNN